MKRIILVAVILLAAALAYAEIRLTLAAPDLQPSYLRWRVERSSQEQLDPLSISASYDHNTRAPMALYYNTEYDRLRRATFVSHGQGDCDQNPDWNCSFLFEGPVGRYNDFAYFRSSDNSYFATGIVYYHPLDEELRYEYAYTKTDGSSGSISYILYSFPSGLTSIGSKPSLVFDADGKAHITFIESSTLNNLNTLWYMHEVETAGGVGSKGVNATVWETNNIRSGQYAAYDPSIAIDEDGKPRIAYYDGYVIALSVAYPSSIFSNCGAGEWRCVIIDNNANTGWYPSFAIDQAGYIAYYNKTRGELWLAKFVGSNGNCGWDRSGFDQAYEWQCEVIEIVGPGLDNMAISLVVDGVDPIIAYRDEEDDAYSGLKLAEPISRLGMTNGNCGPGNSFFCQTIDNQMSQLGNGIDMTIDPNGRLFIAYSQEWMTSIYRLWLARQFFINFLPILNK